jgi:hypothetical protein
MQNLQQKSKIFTEKGVLTVSSFTFGNQKVKYIHGQQHLDYGEVYALIQYDGAKYIILQTVPV